MVRQDFSKAYFPVILGYNKQLLLHDQISSRALMSVQKGKIKDYSWRHLGVSRDIPVNRIYGHKSAITRQSGSAQGELLLHVGSLS